MSSFPLRNLARFRRDKLFELKIKTAIKKAQEAISYSGVEIIPIKPTDVWYYRGADFYLIVSGKWIRIRVIDEFEEKIIWNNLQIETVVVKKDFCSDKIKGKIIQKIIFLSSFSIKLIRLR